MNNFLLRVENIEKYYPVGEKNLQVLKGLTFTLKEKERVVITGVSGSGKSTLLNIIGLLDEPTTGDIYLNDYCYKNLSTNEKNHIRQKIIGFIFQSNQLLRDFTAEENVMLPAYLAGKKHRIAIYEARKILEKIGLKDRFDYYPDKLSGGEAQRVAIARALINNPKLILADEPTGNLDKHSKEDIRTLLYDVCNRFNTTLLVVTHDSEFTVDCDKHFHLEDGKLKSVKINEG